MEMDNPEMKGYLTELCTRTDGDTAAQVSMFELGAALGLDKAEAGMMAEELIVQGFAELKSLSGGIGITAQGVAAVRGSTASASPGNTGVKLGNSLVLGPEARQVVERLAVEIRTACVERRVTLGQLEPIVIDLKTLETQMLSPGPKTAIIREVLRSLQNDLVAVGIEHAATAIDALIRP